MENRLVTQFVFLDGDGKKVDALRDKLLSTNNDFNNLGKNLTFGKTINDNSDLAGKSVDTLKKKVDDFKTTADNLNLKPTISRYWENEANQVTASVKKAENAIDGLKNKSYTPSQPLGFTIPQTAAPTAKTAFADSYKSAFDDLDSRLQKTQSSFQKLAQTRADKGQFDTLYQGAFAAEKKVNDLTNRIRSLRKEAADPLNAKFAKNYTDGIREAESELSRLEKRQERFERAAKQSGGGRGRKGLGETGRAVLEIADDFVPAGFNRPFNAVVKELANINALTATSIGLFGGLAAAGLLVVGITKTIRENAEAHLKSEIAIGVAFNERNIQILAFQKSLTKQDTEILQNSNLDRFLKTSKLSELQDKRRELEREKFSSVKEILTDDYGRPVRDDKGNYQLDAKKQQDLDARILEIKNREKEFVQQQDQLFAQNFENRKKAEEESIQRQIKAAQVFAKSVEDGKEKVKEFGKTVNSVFDNLYQKSNQNNPFVAVFSEADNALKTLKENIKGLPDELKKSALSLQNNLNSNTLFSARLDNALNVFDLKDSASNFRDFREKPFDIKDPKKFFDEYIDFYSKQREKENGGSFIKYAKNSNLGGGTLQYDTRNDLLNVYERTNGIGLTDKNRDRFAANSGGFFQRQRTFADLSEFDKQNYLKSVNEVDSTKNLSLQNRLDKQFSIINSFGAGATDEQLSIANRKIISLTQGVVPSQLTASQRDQAGLAREREAARLEKAEQESRKIQEKQLKVSESIEKHLAALRGIAAKEGLKGINAALEIIVKDNTSSGIDVLGASPKPSDMLGSQSLGTVSGSGGLTNY